MINSANKVLSVWFDGDRMSVELRDGRTITVPVEWFPRPAAASPEQRSNWEIAGAGYGIHWPDLDEDISVEGLLRGAPAPGHGRFNS